MKPLYKLPVPPSYTREEFIDLLQAADVVVRGNQWEPDGRCILWVELEPLGDAAKPAPAKETK